MLIKKLSEKFDIITFILVNNVTLMIIVHKSFYLHIKTKNIKTNNDPQNASKKIKYLSS